MTAIRVRPDVERFADKAKDGYWQEHAAGDAGWREAMTSLCEYVWHLEESLELSELETEGACAKVEEVRGHYETATLAAERQFRDHDTIVRSKDSQIRALTDRLFKYEASRKVRKILGR